MDFSSVPVYLDPRNWNQNLQQQTHPPPGSAFGQLAQQQLPQELSNPRPEANGTVAGPVARPGSMVDRARLAKLPQPEQGMKCPRCDSNNTKFCYFNNYSLTQPRHFCKTCRRYWTRGGALRNVPVGGGFRRNKRIKSSGSSSKPPAAAVAGTSSSPSTISTRTGGAVGAITSSITSQLPFLSSQHPLTDRHYAGLGLGFSGLQPIDSLECQIGSNSSIGLENWRPLQHALQFPFPGGQETLTQQPQQSSSGLYYFDVNGGNGDAKLVSAAQLLPKVPDGGPMSQLASLKIEDSSQDLNLSRYYLALHGNEHFLGVGSGDGVGSSNGANLSNFKSASFSTIF